MREGVYCVMQEKELRGGFKRGNQRGSEGMGSRERGSQGSREGVKERGGSRERGFT